MSPYPFDDIDEFERIRSAAVQDLARAATLVQARPMAVGERAMMRIYAGPPGTGKTVSAVRDAVLLCDPTTVGLSLEDVFRRFLELGTQCRFVTFHPTLQYEDFVQGLLPEAAAEDGGSDLRYRVQDGAFLAAIRSAHEEPGLHHVLVIDEINRGDPGRLFGAFLSALEPDKRSGAELPLPVGLVYTDEEMFLPANLHIFGCMNTTDRALAPLDVALRRRFDIVRLGPDYEALRANPNVPALTVPMLRALNLRVRALRGSDFEIGHGFFARATSYVDVVRVLALKVVPLLVEVFVGEEALVEAVLNQDKDPHARLLTGPDPDADAFVASVLPQLSGARHEIVLDPRVVKALEDPPRADAGFFEGVVTGIIGAPVT